MKKGRMKLVAVALAVLSLAAACGSDNETTDAGAASPIAEFLGEEDFFATDPESRARVADQERARQEVIATCMREQGFEYIPVEDSGFASVTGEDGLDPSSREYTERYGFGYTTMRYSQDVVGPDLVGHTYDQTDEGGESSDPNQKIVEAMDESTAQAYYEALHGDEDDYPVIDETMTEEEIAEIDENFDFTPQGCWGQAYADEFNNDFYQTFDDELEQLYKDVEGDPRIVELEEELTSCMADKGHDFTMTDDGFQELLSELEVEMEKINELTGGSPGDDLTEADFAAMTPEELEQLEEQYNNPPELTTEAKQILAGAQAREIEIALDIYDCGGGENDDSSRVYREVLAEYEQRFLDDNADRLSEYKAEK